MILIANEHEKDFNVMLANSKDMPKIQIITDEASIKKYGGSKMFFAPPIEYDKIMKRIPVGKVITVGVIRDYFAKGNGANFTDPITFSMMRLSQKSNEWNITDKNHWEENGWLNKKRPWIK
ncbi:MAG: methylated DNA-protein cysteine methyltransferase [Oscillospiraceae bacterium]